MRVNIKPISVNACWQGRRFKTKAYLAFEKEVMLTLKPIVLPPAPYYVYYEFGMSNSTSDIDNPLKPIQDILQKKYGFNDKDIMEIHIVKEKVKKGQEYFDFEIRTYHKFTP